MAKSGEKYRKILVSSVKKVKIYSKRNVGFLKFDKKKSLFSRTRHEVRPTVKASSFQRLVMNSVLVHIAATTTTTIDVTLSSVILYMLVILESIQFKLHPRRTPFLVHQDSPPHKFRLLLHRRMDRLISQSEDFVESQVHFYILIMLDYLLCVITIFNNQPLHRIRPRWRMSQSSTMEMTRR